MNNTKIGNKLHGGVMSLRNTMVWVWCLLALTLVSCASAPVTGSSTKTKTSESGSSDIQMLDTIPDESHCYALNKIFYYLAKDPHEEKGNIANFGDAFGAEIHSEKNITYAKMKWDESKTTMSLLLFSQDKKFVLKIDFPNTHILACGPIQTAIMIHEAGRGITVLPSESDTTVTFSDTGEYTQVDSVTESAQTHHLESHGDFRMLDIPTSEH